MKGGLADQEVVRKFLTSLPIHIVAYVNLHESYKNLYDDRIGEYFKNSIETEIYPPEENQFEKFDLKAEDLDLEKGNSDFLYSMLQRLASGTPYAVMERFALNFEKLAFSDESAKLLIPFLLNPVRGSRFFTLCFKNCTITDLQLKLAIDCCNMQKQSKTCNRIQFSGVDFADDTLKHIKEHILNSQSRGLYIARKV